MPTTANMQARAGKMYSAGYVVIQHGTRGRRKAYQRWLDRIPSVYRESVLDQLDPNPPAPEFDPYNLSLLKHYRSLMPMEARKPMFCLTHAIGAIGAHVEVVKACYQDFEDLAQRIAKVAGVELRGLR